MDVLTDWRFWLFVLGLCQTGLMSYGFIILKFNDLKHLHINVEKIEKKVDNLDSTVINIDKELVRQIQRVDDLEKSTK